MRAILLWGIVLGIFSAQEAGRIGFSAEPFPEHLAFETVRTFSHPTDAYCQGLFFERDEATHQAVLYESCGQYGKSHLRVFDAETGKTIREIRLPKKIFAEGLTVVGDEIIQLTWREGIGYVWDKPTLKKKREFRYSTEGWGITFDGDAYIMSDGSAVLRRLAADDFRELGTLSVFYTAKSGEKRPLTAINELEWINGEIWANIYQTPYVARINVKTGEVIEFLNFKGFIPKGYEKDTERVLNGIAWDAASGTIYVTGKNWPVAYELKVVNQAASVSSARGAK